MNDYLTSLQDEMKSNDALFTVYRKCEDELISIGSCNTKKGANNILKEYVSNYEVVGDNLYSIVYYSFTLTPDTCS